MIRSTIKKIFLVSSILAFVGSPVLAETTEGSAGLSLPVAKPGECYAKVIIPAEYKTETEQVIKKEAYEKIEIIPAQYETVTEKVLVKEASEEFVPVSAVYEDQEEVIEVSPARLVWRLGSKSKSSIADPSLLAGAMALGLPATAEVGQCFSEYYQPAQYQTESKKVMVKEASFEIEVIPAKYEVVEEQVMVKQASEKLKEIPPVYETVSEEVLVSPASTQWKKGRGIVERIDGTTGEIMCLIEVPAQYKTVTKRVLKTPATIEKIEIPAEYAVQEVRKMVAPPQENRIEIPAEYETVSVNVKVADAKTGWFLTGTEGAGEPTGKTLCLNEIPAKYETVMKRVMKSGVTVTKVEIPAEYKTLKVVKLVTPAQENRVMVPAQLQTITKEIKVADSRTEWHSVLCETNMSEDLIMQIQEALQKAGYDPGAIDGQIGHQTMMAVDAYQVAKQLSRGGLTMKTINHLGIEVKKQ